MVLGVVRFNVRTTLGFSALIVVDSRLWPKGYVCKSDMWHARRL
jgi:hypothetical protein